MVKRTYPQIRKDILMVLRDGGEYSYGAIERKVNTNWKTVREQTADLAVFGAVAYSKGKVKITKRGRDALKKL